MAGYKKYRPCARVAQGLEDAVGRNPLHRKTGNCFYSCGEPLVL